MTCGSNDPNSIFNSPYGMATARIRLDIDTRLGMGAPFPVQVRQSGRDLAHLLVVTVACARLLAQQVVLTWASSASQRHSGNASCRGH